MLSPRPLASSALALLGLAATLGFASTARATPSMTITSKTTISADLLVDELTVAKDGTLEVKPMASGGTGMIHIRARKITVMAGGVISATKAGYTGVNDKDGSSADGSGGGKRSMTLGHPGSGGGYFGVGAEGASDTCMPFGDTKGGVAFAMPTATKPILGSAGGAANTTTPGNAGGAGGGVILLEAARIVIDGTVEARGESPSAVGGVGRGGGSGGFIAITAAQLAGAGVISVAGGNGSLGGTAGMPSANHGGGGAGGVILITASEVAASIQNQLDIKGGATGGCDAMRDAAKGDQKSAPVADVCVDVDGDMQMSSACGGDDCDDSDAAILLSATNKEVCNGVDDNCNGMVDEGDDLCPAGRTCDADAKACVVIDDGVDAGPGVDAGAPPDHITFESGCSLRGDAMERRDSESAFVLLGLGLGALVTRRRRASRLDRGPR